MSPHLFVPFPLPLLAQCGAQQAHFQRRVQSLWSGYGAIERWRLEGGARAGQSVILKRIAPPTAAAHPRGWHSDLSHRRKLLSYQVESEFYRRYALRCEDTCRVPHCLGLDEQVGETRLLLEDLDAAGFSGRRLVDEADPSEAELGQCVEWLARFHARFLGGSSDGLWPIGTYWHLDTRPEEWAQMTDNRLQAAAAAIDARLNGAQFQTLVHGDAKLANFCFRANSAHGPDGVAAVDFQYIGGGVGVKDLAYLLGSAYHGEALAARTEHWLDCYMSCLRQALKGRVESELDALEREWRGLYPYAVADFERFLNGWAPGHWKVNGYTSETVQHVLAQLS
ncbi:phosphotransferase [Ferrimonas pelagia]|uniref:DUF1679 domain-containing protein n=1 Tax=Ferrimonas pelagia TaxID=1177826 RepID=A0ABP9EQR2_9GAMM